MFDLTSAFGDLYEGHIIRINNDKLILLLASAHYSHVKFAQMNTDPTDNMAHISQVGVFVRSHLCASCP